MLTLLTASVILVDYVAFSFEVLRHDTWNSLRHLPDTATPNAFNGLKACAESGEGLYLCHAGMCKCDTIHSPISRTYACVSHGQPSVPYRAEESLGKMPVLYRIVLNSPTSSQAPPVCGVKEFADNPWKDYEVVRLPAPWQRVEGKCSLSTGAGTVTDSSEISSKLKESTIPLAYLTCKSEISAGYAVFTVILGSPGRAARAAERLHQRDDAKTATPDENTLWCSHFPLLFVVPVLLGTLFIGIAIGAGISKWINTCVKPSKSQVMWTTEPTLGAGLPGSEYEARTEVQKKQCVVS